MEKENNKREREEEMKGKDPLGNTSERQYLDSHKHQKVEITGRDDEENSKRDDYLELGVFDFPWRKESLISKSEEEDWCFEDSFFNNSCTTAAVESEFPDQCLSENAENFTKSIDFPSDNFEETVWALETWTSINA